jgi:SAM-dependent methyltransferase
MDGLKDRKGIVNDISQIGWTWEGKQVSENGDWGRRAQRGFLASGIDPGDRRGHKNVYIDLLQKMALEEALALRGDEIVLDFGCGSGRISHWIAPRVKKVLGLEVTSEMLDLARQNQTSDNVEWMLYDGIHFPDLSYSFDLLLSVGVLQIMRGESLKETVSHLSRYLKSMGNMVLIEQVSDHLRVNRPRLQEYLEAFKRAELTCLQHYPIRKGRGGVLTLIRYGMIPRSLFRRIARSEMACLRNTGGSISYYQDYLFILKKL